VTDVVVLHPGAMGSRLGGELRAAGHAVGWVPQGRSNASAERAGREGLTPIPWADLASADVAVCSCAPQGAVDVARRVADAGFAGLYVEANPLSPAALARIGELLPTAVRLVDAAVIGPPPGRATGPTQLVLSGPPDDVAAAQRLWIGTLVETVVAGQAIGAASAAKTAFALFNKGRLALAVLARALARDAGVSDVMQAQANRPGVSDLVEPDLEAQLAAVAWRWGPEFDHIAETLDHYGLSPQAAIALRQVWTALLPGTAADD